MADKLSVLDLNSIVDIIRSGSENQNASVTPDIVKKAQLAIQSFSKYKSANEKKSFEQFLTVLSKNPFCHKFAAHVPPDLYKQFAKALISSKSAHLIPHFLDIFRSPKFLSRIYEQKEWPDLVLKLLKTGNYTFPKMFFHRAEKYKNKTLFTVLESKRNIDYSWTKISRSVTSYACGLLALLGGTTSKSKIAFFTKNSLDMVLFDLACLTSGIVNVMIPANSVPAHIEYILKKTRPAVLIVSDHQAYEKISSIINRLDFITSVVILKDQSKGEEKCYSKTDVLELGKSIDLNKLEERRSKPKLDDLVSLMFTSGTTGNPKGIQFSQQNIVFKRFARAMALPEIGENDIFLSYLPLFHTFGRWLEMTGSIFWGARYIFMENPAPEIMIENMQRVKPTIFISIPKKWYQIYEMVTKEINIVEAGDEEIQRVVNKLTGGQLKWGLSAAGYLDVEVFQFFQRHHIELMSGFGMTEATGGITMTPPGRYKPDSLGKALPGIELKLGNDGELLIKGPYVMMGYVNPEESDVPMEDGWLATGDIMQIDDGYMRIIDRKKEIYKNVKGETIAPQKIENYFRDFDFLKHVFLVGDNKPYNTLLIYPNYQYKEIQFKEMSAEEIRSYFSSVIVSVNRFLSPYERIVDFSIIDRDFDADKNELTPKGTYKRKVVEANFSEFIKPMYDRNYIPISVKKREIHVPSWFLREKGLTPDEVHFTNDHLQLRKSSRDLKIKITKDHVQIGDYRYDIPGKIINIGRVLTDPVLWLGNTGIVDFAGYRIFKWRKTEESNSNITYQNAVDPPKLEKEFFMSWLDAKSKDELSLEGIHGAASLLREGNGSYSMVIMEYLARATKDKDLNYIRYAKEILRRTLELSSLNIQREAFILLLNTSFESVSGYVNRSFLDKSANFINEDVIEKISLNGLDDEKMELLFRITREFCQEGDKRGTRLLQLLSRYGASHPTRYKIIRQFLASCQLEGYEPMITKAARAARLDGRDGFRRWLGTTQDVAVDIETGEEYHWEDVVIFEESIDPKDEIRLLSAIKNTTLIREAVFLFSKGVLVRLNDIPPGGVWISLLGKEHGKAVYRVTIQTRYQGSFDIAVNVNHSLKFELIRDEINWLIQSGTTVGAVKLVEDFGGYWKEYDLWSEEFIQGETAGKFIRRHARQQESGVNERLMQIWPYFIWTGINAYIQFWTRTKNRLELKEPSPNNIIIPVHDYQTGSRIVSISARRKHLNPLDMLKKFSKYYIESVEEEFPVLKGIGENKYIMSAVIEALGHKEGVKFLEKCLKKLSKKKVERGEKKLTKDLEYYLSSLKKSGFIPKRLYFAIRRYNRWRHLNPNATAKAQAATLSEIFGTYELNLLEIEYPETRTRYFKETVFKNANKSLIKNLDKIISEQQKGHLTIDRFTHHISMLQKSIKLSDDEIFFLTRLSYPHLQPTDSANLISTERGGIAHTDLVVKSRDYEGGSFFIRTPVNPKEIARLHQLFLINNLSVQFRPDHLYLIAINERNQLIGGLFYSKIAQETVHIEKIVVADFYRKKGVSDGILNEFFKRMRNEHYEFVTTGFFRPEYFYRFGFKIERKYAGLVKKLSEESVEKITI
jgi:long-subunit acyl-CoA synthetase (AMP-forming)